MPKRDRSKQSNSFSHIVDMSKMTTLEGLGEEVYKVVSIMFHPNDAAARRTFVASAVVDMKHRLRDANLLSDKRMDIPSRAVSILDVDRLLDEAMPSVLHFKGAKGRSGERDGYTGTVIAAAILARALAAAEKGENELGIAQIISDQGDEYRQEGLIGTGRDSLTEIWQEYRASAHIALACIGMGSGRRFHEDPTVLFEWVARSEDLLKAGNAIGSRFGDPILPPGECWNILWRPSLGG